jgi:hypothetical protein
MKGQILIWVNEDSTFTMQRTDFTSMAQIITHSTTTSIDGVIEKVTKDIASLQSGILK